MNLFLRLVLGWWIKQPISRRVNWSSEDREMLDFFLRSPCGKKFILKLREAAADVSFRSVYASSREAVSSAGYARGVCDSLGLVFRLAKSFPTLESEYAVAESAGMPGTEAPAIDRGSGWSEFLGGGGAIAPR